MSEQSVFKLNFCRLCKGKGLKKIIDLGFTPPANSFLKEKNNPETFFPLKVNFCTNCRQLQLSHVVNPDILFKEYVYVSSTSPVFIKHFEDYAKDVVISLKTKKDALVVDIGSNDGILLKPFKSLGMRVLGVDPAVKIAKKTTKEGIETIPDYFSMDIAEKIIEKKGHASIVTANNVFAHVNDLDSLTEAVEKLLNKDGVFVIEAPYLAVFLQNNLFDTIYHEHLSYLSVKPLVSFFQRFNMRVFDVWETSSHGGSIRLFVAKQKSKHKKNPSVNKLLKKEEKLGLDNLTTYTDFAQRIKNNKSTLQKLLKKLKKNNSKIVGFGAPAKGNTLLNYFRIGDETLDYIVDDSSYKQNLYTPGTHIKVVSPKKIEHDNPDYIFILAWNFAEPIMKRFDKYRKNGSHFIIPIPEPKVI